MKIRPCNICGLNRWSLHLRSKIIRVCPICDLLRTKQKVEEVEKLVAKFEANRNHLLEPELSLMKLRSEQLKQYKQRRGL